MRKTAGFTLVELLVTLALVGIAASVVFPLATVIQTRAKESELRRDLRTIRQALDTYKQYADSGLIDKKTGKAGYPTSLEQLTKGIPRSSSFGLGGQPIIFLRVIPRDPFSTEDLDTPAANTWNVRYYGYSVGDFRKGDEIFDVSSKSDKSALDGSLYKDW